MKHNEAWAEHAHAQMTMSEKIGQMTQASKDSITPAEGADHAVGSIQSRLSAIEEGETQDE